LVEVPIRVTVPPTTAAKLTGISRREGERPVRRHQDSTGGIAIATIGVLLRNAEADAVSGRIRASVPRSLLPPARGERAASRPTTVSSTRVRATAAAST